MNFEVGKHYRDRQGHKLRCLATDGEKNFPIICMDLNDKEKSVDGFNNDGFWDIECGENRRDIISEWRDPVRVEGWVNVLSPGSINFNTIYPTKKSAELRMTEDCIACVYVSGIEEVQ